MCRSPLQIQRGKVKIVPRLRPPRNLPNLNPLKLKRLKLNLPRLLLRKLQSRRNLSLPEHAGI
jgi:hypothetical protein